MKTPQSHKNKALITKLYAIIKSYTFRKSELCESLRFGLCEWTRPNMGVAQCYIGSPKMELNEDISFINTSEFLYCQVSQKRSISYRIISKLVCNCMHVIS